jgi:putative exosortase-associated protein (TIGR04073 family)
VAKNHRRKIREPHCELRHFSRRKITPGGSTDKWFSRQQRGPLARQVRLEIRFTTRLILVTLGNNIKSMRKSPSILIVAAFVGLIVAGCAGPQQKLGLGINNTLECIRWGEANRSVEQAALFQSPTMAYSGGAVTGVCRSFGRTMMGVAQIATFPLPPYGPVWTSEFTPYPAFPDSYKPGLPNSPVIATDSSLGFSGGEIMPVWPGSRFKVFDNN